MDVTASAASALLAPGPLKGECFSSKSFSGDKKTFLSPQQQPDSTPIDPARVNLVSPRTNTDASPPKTAPEVLENLLSKIGIVADLPPPFYSLAQARAEKRFLAELFKHIEEVARKLEMLHKNGFVHGEVTPYTILLPQAKEATSTACLVNSGKVKRGFGVFQEERIFKDPFSFFGFFSPLSDIYGLASMLSWLFTESPGSLGDTLKKSSETLMRSMIRGEAINFDLSVSERYPFEHQIRLVCYEQMCVLDALMKEASIDLSVLHGTSAEEKHIKSSVSRGYQTLLEQSGSPQALHEKIATLTSKVEASMREKNIRVVNIQELLDIARKRLDSLFSQKASPVDSGMLARNYSPAASGPSSAANTGVADQKVLEAMKELEGEDKDEDKYRSSNSEL